MRPYLTDLIDRLTRPEPGISSDTSVSWAAHREAEKLVDASMIEELARHAAEDRSKARRAACYFTIGKIGKNLGSPECAELLLRFLSTETVKDNLASILDLVGGIPKPPTFDLSPAYPFLDDKRWLVRHAAIRALDNSQADDVETWLLHHLSKTDDPYDQTYCHSVLNRIGTEQSIPRLEAGLTSRKRDVKISAELALAAIRARQGEQK